jgi:hypothetical protein
MTATMTSRSGIVEPDHKTRVHAATLTLAYSIGKPINRQEIVSVNIGASADEDLASRLKKSPALRRMMLRIIAEAEAGAVIDG